MIEFFSEDITFAPEAADELRFWLQQIVKAEQGVLGDLNFIYCSKAYLLSLNQKFLKHNTDTDILTFDQSTTDSVSGDIYISIDQVRENAIRYGEPFNRELKRVMVHGVLHLLGCNDRTIEEKKEMRKKEEAYLSL